MAPNKKPYDDMTFGERAMTLPDRHPVPVKMLIWLFMEYGYDFRFLEVVARAMGWMQVKDSQDVDFPLGAGTVKATLTRLGWIDLNEVEAPKDEN